MIKIHGRNNSSNVQKVVWALNEMNLPYARIDAGGQFGLVNEPHYLAMNPNARVPTMEDNGFILWESNAIIRYIGSKYGNDDIIPSDIQTRASADRWMDWQQTTVAPIITPIFWGLVRTPEEKRNLETIEENRIKMIDVMRILDENLSDKPYVAGDRFTIGDIPLGIMVYRWFTLIQNRPQMGNLESWYNGLEQRPAFKTHVLDIPLT
ncbi:MAG: glutathione S-transferase [Rhodospirillaceae bacterium]|nr:glutathione S-transferase [Rhodospirillaceae bacterium]|tara:strand:+ start:609 stop:1232 length:624 start_codon:yes stop_codon:yes gene_type:complete